MIKNKIIFLLPVLSGVLLVLAYPPIDLWFLVFVALIPLLLFVYKNKSVFWGGFLAGVVFFGILFSWYFATYPFEWLSLGANKTEVLILLIIFYILQTAFLGLFFGVFTAALKKVARLSLATFLIIPAFWIVLEYLHAWGFGILYLGKETLFGPHWTFGNLAYTLHGQSKFIQIADLGGIYLISFLIVLVNVGLFLFLKKRDWKIAALLAIIVVAWAGYAYVGFQKPNIEKKIALLQTSFPSGNQKQAFEPVLDLFKTDKKADIIIAPEGFGIVSLANDVQIAKYLLKDFYKPGQIYLDSKNNTLFYWNLEKEDPLGTHNKLLLVPNGDFLPYLTKLLANTDEFKDRFYEKGETIKPVQGIGGTICSSIVSPNIQRAMTNQGAEFLAVVSSDAPFHGSKSLLAQNLAMSKLRAVENRRYFAQATNMGYSFLLNPKGEIIAKNNELGNKLLFVDVQFLNEKTVYTKFGDWPVFLSTAILLLTGILWYNRKRNLL